MNTRVEVSSIVAAKRASIRLFKFKHHLHAATLALATTFARVVSAQATPPPTQGTDAQPSPSNGGAAAPTPSSPGTTSAPPPFVNTPTDHQPIQALQAPVGDVVPRQRVDALEETLAKLNDENSPSIGLATVGIVEGAAWLGFGTWFAFGKSAALGDGIDRAVGLMGALGLGVPPIVSGIRTLSGRTSTDQDRFVRFQLERRAGPFTSTQLAHYEGELEADAALAKKLRIGGAFGGVSLIAVGGVLIGFGAASRRLGDTGRGLACAEGAVFLAGGTWVAVSGFSGESNNEREWRLYREKGENVRQKSARFTVVPLVMPHAAMLDIVSVF